jgi:hypothetical protein
MKYYVIGFTLLCCSTLTLQLVAAARTFVPDFPGCGIPVSTSCDQLVNETSACSYFSCFNTTVVNGVIVWKCKTGDPGSIVVNEVIATENHVQEIGFVDPWQNGKKDWTEGAEITCANKKTCSCPQYVGNEVNKPCNTIGATIPEKFNDWVPGGPCWVP